MEEVLDASEGHRHRFRQLQNEHIGYQSLTDIPVQRAIAEEDRNFAVRRN